MGVEGSDTDPNCTPLKEHVRQQLSIQLSHQLPTFPYLKPTFFRTQLDAGYLSRELALIPRENLA
jgi:hypothetical protein